MARNFRNLRSSEGSIEITTPPTPVPSLSKGKIFPELSSTNLNENYILIEIEDSGIGMTDQARNELFNPFKQNQRLAGGTGLGLYSLAKRIDALQGFYGVSKRKDGSQGSLFWFAIPYRPDREMALSLATDSLRAQIAAVSRPKRQTILVDTNNSPPSIRPPELSTKTDRNFCSESPAIIVTGKATPVKRKYNILIADDTPSIVKMMSRMLQKQGHQVSSADNGAIALDMVKETLLSASHQKVKYDLVLMDLQMPVMDGLESTKRIREFEKDLEESQGIKHHQIIICVSANSDSETIEEAQRAGVDGFIPKPFTAADFHAQAKALLESSQ